MRIAVLGLGNMGKALAARLLATGHVVRVWNRTPDKARDLVAAGATQAGSPAEAARETDAVLLSLADDAAVRAVALGSGLTQALGESVLVDTSTVAPTTTRELAAACPPGRMLAAPILAPPHGVTAGKALLLVAGPEPAVNRLDAVWSALGTRRFCGEEPGLGTTHKLIANFLLMSGIAALSEAVVLGQAAGVPNAALRDFLATVPVVGPVLVNRLDDLIAGDHAGWFTTTLGAKDVRLAAELGASAGVELPLARFVEQRYEQAAASGFANADIAAVVELVRRPR